ncbi:regulatory protein, luxR family [Loktanella fryxellensis]|uniref:Regulatory protein, luxR family n=1 Tax=Loktanella fryxellensis TaxID=245187 RepID=A0A1H8HHJ1_9RHOB|nr:LuxR C-terminal-related transcriptional regulator [Loktanella fryxellensis]SEN55623.1 regulatory protein, luxR family [Loktanella fryxellensis]
MSETANPCGAPLSDCADCFPATRVNRRLPQPDAPRRVDPALAAHDIAAKDPAPLDRQTSQADLLHGLLCGLNLPILHVCPDMRLHFMTPAAAELLGLCGDDRHLPPGCDLCDTDAVARVCRTGDAMTLTVHRPDGRVWACHILPHDTNGDGPGGAIVILIAHEAAPSLAVAEALTPRQHQIMDLVLAGHPSKNIAADLHISQRTVESHRAAIMRRTGAMSLPALARLAVGIAADADSTVLAISHR